jgi:hypothetical protein
MLLMRQLYGGRKDTLKEEHAVDVREDDVEANNNDKRKEEDDGQFKWIERKSRLASYRGERRVQ